MTDGMMGDLALFLIGLLLLPVAAEVLVRGAVGLANRAGISPLVVGLTVVAMGTSAPELVVCVNAALNGAPGIAYGNVIGSNIANVLLILGAAALITPILCGPRATFLRDTLAMLAATVVFIALTLTGVIVAWQGGLMVALLGGYLLWSYLREKGGLDPADVHVDEVAELDSFKTTPAALIAVLVLGGLIGVVWGADLLVDGAIGLARGFGVPETVIGLTLVAIGTSLPELATAGMAAWRGHNDVAVGNVVGSNVFNLLGIMGATALVAPVPAPLQIMTVDVWVMLAASLLLLPFVLSGGRITRPAGVAFLGCYGLYVAWQFAPGIFTA